MDGACSGGRSSPKRNPPSGIMKMRWVVTTKVDDSLKARLVVQGFTDTRLGKIQTSSPTSSRRARQIFLTTVASLHFQCHKGDAKCAFLQDDLDGAAATVDADPADGDKLQEDVFCDQVQNWRKRWGWSTNSAFDYSRPSTAWSTRPSVGTTMCPRT